MKLKQCPSCGGKVSKKATACMACGHPMKRPPTGLGKVFENLVGFVLTVVILGGLLLYFIPKPLTKAQWEEKGTPIKKYTESDYKLGDAIRRQLVADSNAEPPVKKSKNGR